MLNNKAYVLTPMILFIILIIALSVYNQITLSDRLIYDSIMVEMMINKYTFFSDNYFEGILSAETLRAYGILSNAKSTQELNNLVSGNTISFSTSNNGVVIFVYVPVFNLSEPWINLSIGGFLVNKTMFYPINYFISELNDFNQALIQNCLNSFSCSSVNINQVLSFCLDSYRSSLEEGTYLINLTKPAFENNNFKVNLGLINNNAITGLFPYVLGEFSFQCQNT